MTTSTRDVPMDMPMAAAEPTRRGAAIRLALPKGRMHAGVAHLLEDAGMPLRAGARDYRPALAGTAAGSGSPHEAFEAKLLKPRAIVEMLRAGRRDAGFAGADWVEETGADLVEVLDTGLDPVRLIAAAPAALLRDGALPDRPLVVASEYEGLARRWIEGRRLEATVLCSYGATEVLPPEDADCIIDNTATGATLAANGLTIIDELMTSSTRLYASHTAMAEPGTRERIERFALLLGSVLEARQRAMLEVNVPAERLDAVVAALPCMREPTVSPLRSNSGYAVKAAVRRDELAGVIPLIKQLGGTDIVVTRPEQIVP